MHTQTDISWMYQALELANLACEHAEVPVGAVLVRDGQLIGTGWNQPIGKHDPSAHAEIQALRDAGQRIGNYRFPSATLYCTLEPCPMCAGAIIHARIAQVVYGAADPKNGACGSVFNLLPADARFNHRTACYGGVLAHDCGELLRQFFYARRNAAQSNIAEGFNDNYAVTTQLEALLFDVDGTLVDNERDGHRVAFNRAFAEFELDWFWSVDTYGGLLSVAGGKERIKYFIKTMCPPLPEVLDIDNFITDVHRLKTRIYNDMLASKSISLRPGIARLLQEAKNAGLKLGIVTSTSFNNVMAVLRATLGEKAPGWFNVIAAGDQVTAKKPAPDIYQYAIKQLGIRPNACIAFEDSANGLQSALGAGIKHVIVTVTDYTRTQDFGGASVVLENLGEPTTPCCQLAPQHLTPDSNCVDLAFLQSLHANNQ